MLLNAIYLRKKNEIWCIKRQHNNAYTILYSTKVNTSMCKSCSNMVNFTLKSLPKPTLLLRLRKLSLSLHVPCWHVNSGKMKPYII